MIELAICEKSTELVSARGRNHNQEVAEKMVYENAVLERM